MSHVSPTHRALPRRAVLLMLVALCGVGVAETAAAGRNVSPLVERAGMSLEEAADRVQSAYGGQVVAASPARNGGREGYRVRVLLDDGRVITVFVDADSGAMRQTG